MALYENSMNRIMDAELDTPRSTSMEGAGGNCLPSYRIIGTALDSLIAYHPALLERIHPNEVSDVRNITFSVVMLRNDLHNAAYGNGDDPHAGLAQDAESVMNYIDKMRSECIFTGPTQTYFSAAQAVAKAAYDKGRKEAVGQLAELVA